MAFRPFKALFDAFGTWQDNRTERVETRQQNKTERTQNRQDSRTDRRELKEQTDQTAYANGIDPKAAYAQFWGQFTGNLTSMFSPMAGNNKFLPSGQQIGSNLPSFSMNSIVLIFIIFLLLTSNKKKTRKR